MPLPTPLRLHPLIGDYGLSSEDAYPVTTALAPYFQQTQPIQLDFSGILVLAPPFLHTIFHACPKAIFLSRLTLIHDDPDLHHYLNVILKNARDYIQHPATQQAVDLVMATLVPAHHE